MGCAFSCPTRPLPCSPSSFSLLSLSLPSSTFLLHTHTPLPSTFPSALEIDLDFDLAVRPAPKPTEETTKSLEDLIKKRIAEQKFDDPIRFVAPPPQKKRPELELNDEKSKKGLADIYEDEFLGLAAQVRFSRVFRDLFFPIICKTNLIFSTSTI